MLSINKKLIITFIFLLSSLFLGGLVKAEDQGCCEKVLKTTLKFEVESMSEEACKALKKDTEKYENATWFKDKVPFLGRCRSEKEISNNSSLPQFTLPEIAVNIPGLIKFAQPDFCQGSQTDICINWIGQYIQALVNYLTMTIGIIAAITLMLGGVRWLTAAGNSQAIGEAKKSIINSLLGLILTLCSYIILITINPNIISFSPLKIVWLETISLMKNKTIGGDCNNGECTQIDEAVNNNSEGISGAIMKSIMVGGEGCNPAVSKDGYSSCGYCQAIPDTRIKVCGLKGDLSDCELFKKDIQADINCSAKVMMEMAPRCGNFEDIRNLASCYNSGKPNNCPNTTDHYCDRVEDYYTNKCQAKNTTQQPKNNETTTQQNNE